MQHSQSSALLSIATIKHIDQKKSVEVFLNFTVHMSGKELKAGPGGRDWSRGPGGERLTGSLPMACLVCFLIIPRTTCPGMKLPLNGLGLLISILRQEIALQTCLQANLMRTFSQSSVLFLDNSNLYQADKKLTRTGKRHGYRTGMGGHSTRTVKKQRTDRNWVYS